MKLEYYIFEVPHPKGTNKPRRDVLRVTSWMADVLNELNLGARMYLRPESLHVFCGEPSVCDRERLARYLPSCMARLCRGQVMNMLRCYLRPFGRISHWSNYRDRYGLGRLVELDDFMSDECLVILRLLRHHRDLDAAALAMEVDAANASAALRAYGC